MIRVADLSRASITGKAGNEYGDIQAQRVATDSRRCVVALCLSSAAFFSRRVYVGGAGRSDSGCGCTVASTPALGYSYSVLPDSPDLDHPAATSGSLPDGL